MDGEQPDRGKKIGKRSRPLTATQTHLLQLCVRLKTSDAKLLANSLGIKPCTIEVHFKNIREILGVHDRTGALVIAIEEEWIEVSRPEREFPES